jgi:hypothetical protein
MRVGRDAAGLFQFESGTEQTPLKSCDRIVRMPDAFSPVSLRGNSGPSLAPDSAAASALKGERRLIF